MKKQLLFIPSLLMLMSAGSFAQTMDQSNTGTSTTFVTINSGTFATQTFTAGMSGPFSRVDLDYSSTGCTAIQINIYSLPSYTQIATETVTLGNPNTLRALHTHLLTAQPLITSGSQYMIAVYSSCPTGGINWFDDQTGPYAGGNEAVNAVQNNGDLYFRTWVGAMSGVAPVSPEYGKPVISPNPSTGMFTVDLSMLTLGKDAKAIVYDMIGNVVYSENVSGKMQTKIDLGTISRGIYFVKIADGSVSFMNKIIVE